MLKAAGPDSTPVLVLSRIPGGGHEEERQGMDAQRPELAAEPVRARQNQRTPSGCKPLDHRAGKQGERRGLRAGASGLSAGAGGGVRGGGCRDAGKHTQ